MTVFLDARRFPPTVKEEVNVTLARQYRDQAREAAQESGGVVANIPALMQQYVDAAEGLVGAAATALQPGAPVTAIAGAVAQTELLAEQDAREAGDAFTFAPAVNLGDWMEVALDSTGRPSEGLKRDGTYWRAFGGQLRQVYPDPRSLAESFAAPTVGEWLTLTVDANGRPVEGIDRAGTQYLAINGVMTPVGGGGVDPTYPDTSAALNLSDWLDLTVDQDSRPVSGTDVRGRQYLAVGGQLRPLAELAVNPMVALGDSTTYGADLVTPLADRWTTLLSAEMGRPITNLGISGQRAEEIAARMGAEQVSGKVTGGSIPATGSVQITGLAVNPVRGAGSTRFNVRLPDLSIVRGSITYVDETTVAFTASGLAAPVAADYVDFFADGAAAIQNGLAFIGAGINNEPLITGSTPTQTISQLKGWYRKMTSSLQTNPKRMVVWGMLDRGTAEAAGTPIGDFIRTMEAWLTEEYGTDFCPVRQYLASQRALDEAAIVQPGFAPIAADNTAVAAGVVPPSFRANAGTVHLGPLGHKMQTLCLKRHLLSPPKRWLLGL
ncbi:MAG TPA: hypothetical protein VMQ93_17215 [Novosphingobium sp.]|nr:hypothetical protein [Novosphingobium sp.]